MKHALTLLLVPGSIAGMSGIAAAHTDTTTCTLNNGHQTTSLTVSSHADNAVDGHNPNVTCDTGGPIGGTR